MYGGYDRETLFDRFDVFACFGPGGTTLNCGTWLMVFGYVVTVY